MAAVNYAEAYSVQVDERFKAGAMTDGIVNRAYDWLGVETVKVYSIPTVGLNDYSLIGTNRYGTPSELGNETQEMKITQDKSFTFTIDRKSYDDTMMTMEAGKALRRQIDEVVIPAVDEYRIAKIVAGAPSENVVTQTVTKTNAYEEFLKVQEILDDKKVPMVGRVVLVTPGFHNKIKLDEAFTKKGDMATQLAMNGVVGEIDGVPCVKVPKSYFPTNVDFVITNPICAPGPVKLQEYKIHTDAPGISGWLVEGRVRFDAFVLNEKKNAIGVHMSSASTLGVLTVNSVAGTVSGDTKVTVSPSKTSDNGYKYKIGDTASSVIYGQNVQTWTAWDGSADITASNGKVITVVECDASYKAVKSGKATVIAKA